MKVIKKSIKPLIFLCMVIAIFSPLSKAVSVSLSEDLTLLQSVQAQIESGNLAIAIKTLKGIPDSPQKRAIEGNLYARQGDFKQAIILYTSALPQFSGEMKIRLAWNLLSTLREREEYLSWQMKFERDPRKRESLRSAIAEDRYLALSVAQDNAEGLEVQVALWGLNPAEVNVNRLRERLKNFEDSPLKVEMLLAVGEEENAVKVAEGFGEPRLLSWTYGASGEKFLKAKDFEGAIAFCDKARVAANRINDHLAIARWQHCLANGYEGLGEMERAKASYEVAVGAIARMREELVGFRVNPLTLKQVNEILRDYLVVLLMSPTEEDLLKSIQVQKLSTLNALDTYFRSTCDLDVGGKKIIAPDTANLYSILLEDRAYLIYQDAEGVKFFPIDVPVGVLEEKLYLWRLQLSDASSDAHIDLGRELYGILLRPVEQLLSNKTKIVFVQDGILRTVPMAALIVGDQYGDQYLVEKYHISYSLGFSLSADKLYESALVAGATTKQMEELPFVRQEVSIIGELLKAEIVEGEKLTQESLARMLKKNSYGIIHLATRNQISPDIEDSKLSLGKEEISLLEFERLLMDRSGGVDFINLSACDTATGNPIAALGLSGIALRTGIPNSVGSLWGIPDERTKDFMVSFYRHLKKEDYSAALRKAQIDAIQDPSSRPYAWAGFIFLSNR
jgi:CHAT domain-containing protein